jgi:hypothetical protein
LKVFFVARTETKEPLSNRKTWKRNKELKEVRERDRERERREEGTGVEWREIEKDRE